MSFWFYRIYHNYAVIFLYNDFGLFFIKKVSNEKGVADKVWGDTTDDGHILFSTSKMIFSAGLASTAVLPLTTFEKAANLKP